ncbi:MAG: RsmB/NOP family class I SAM-dependent RNA methyltransferase, partial [Bacteroidota bacterium]
VKVIERTLKADKRRGARDRAFIAENIYEIVRWYRLLYTLRGAPPKTEADWWEMIGIRYLIDGHQLPNWREFKALNAEVILKRYEVGGLPRAVNESIPDWIDQLCEKELQEKWAPTLAALNHPAKVVLRVNRLKGTARELVAMLKLDDVVTSILDEESLLVEKRQSLFKTRAFQEGRFEFQDFSSQQVAPFCEVAPGMRVVDACAGAGGKTLHLASRMQNKGQLIALDNLAWKLGELKKRARRAGVFIIETRHIENSKVIKRLAGQADRVLLDVPCSGLGVLKRNPDSKWKLKAEFIAEIKKTQQHILQSYSRMVKDGGKLIYATCSVLPSENQEQVDQFLKSEAGQGFQLEEQRSILPQDEGFDGFFMARLKKN